ncbi:MAG: DUF3737 family protein [Alistipes sp.]
MDRCFFDVGARYALWYSDHLKMTDTRTTLPRCSARCMTSSENVEMTDADEVFWRCNRLNIKTQLHGGTYPFMFCN